MPTERYQDEICPLLKSGNIRVLPDGVDLQPSADGRGKSMAESAARLARMVGEDANALNHAHLIALAEHLAGLQRSQLMAAVERVEASRQGTRSVVVGAGIGRGRTGDTASGRP
jgi:uncharacterized hydantoinase/oxoprolinase family protein